MNTWRRTSKQAGRTNHYRYRHRYLVEIQSDLAVDTDAEVVVHDELSVLLTLPEPSLAGRHRRNRPPVQHGHLLSPKDGTVHRTEKKQG